MASNPWEMDWNTPQSGPVYGPAPDPMKVEDQVFQRNADARANEAAERAARAEARAERAENRAAVKDAEGTESERTAGFLATRLRNSMTQLGSVGASDRASLSPTMGVEAVRGIAGDRAANFFTEENRQTVRAAEIDILDAALTLGTGAAYNKEQLEGYRESYFPQLGDETGTVKAKQERLLGLLEAARLKAGRAAPDIDAAIATYSQLLQAPPQEAPKGGDDDEGLTGTVTYDPSEWKDGKYVGPNGSPDAPAMADNPRLYGSPDSFGMGGLSTLGMQGVTLGLSDEAAGIGGAIAGALTGKGVQQGYTDARDAERIAIERARQSWGVPGTVYEFAGGGGALKAIPNSVRNAMLQGGGIGATGGFGYGEGAEGSLVNAGGGAVLGGAFGGGAQYVANALAPRMAGQANLGQRADDLYRTGQAENVTVNRAMIDPRLQNRVSGVDSTIAGGPIVQREMQAIEGQIGDRVTNLGRGGNQMEPVQTGDTVKNAAERFIDKTGKSASAKYTRAEQMAGDAKVQPKESARRVDEMIASLSETPTTNAKEVAFLEGIKADLSKDLSVGGLRRMRTALRKKISSGELVFGEDEARVLAIMDGAADDIRTGLTAQGKQGAAQAFDAADKAYRARMEYITGTVQKLVGKRNANLPSEEVARRFTAMANGKDARGLQKFYATLSPEEQADVAATFAGNLGKNNKGDFSVAHFLSQSEKLSDDALRTVFGKEGATSIQNLRQLGKEVTRVTGAMNSRTSKTGVANDWRSWLANFVFGGATGIATESGLTGIATAATGMAIKSGRDILSARALMSPNLSKWLRNAPRTNAPQAIDKHFAQLGNIAKLEPALAGEIDMLRNAIMSAANDNASVTRSFASDENAQK